MAKEPINSQESARGAEVVVPSDTVNFTSFTRGLYVGTAGDVAVIMRDGSSVTFTALAAGIVHPLSLERVDATNTTALLMVALF